MKRKSLFLLAALAFCVAFGQHQTARAGVLDADAMKAALHTATPQEGGFIDNVVAMVDQGKLPLDLVQSTFLWAKKKPHKRFFYFRQAMILRAEAIGIKIS